MSSWAPPAAPRAPQISRVPYLPGLDGLRAIAVIAVMVYHANHTWLHGGFLGVEVFFVISGYLITLLLIAEHERNDRVDLGQFWLRRFRRLLPALLVMMAGLAVYVAVFFRKAQGRVRGDFVGGIGYVSNWYQVWVGAGYTQAEAFAPLRHLWSLAVEEQFYLVWPLVMVLILRRGREHLPRVAMVLVGVSVAITIAVAVLYAPGDVATTCAESSHGYWTIAGRCINANDALYLSTITRAGGLMLGAAFAMVWRPFALMRGPMRDKGRQLDVVALAGLVVLGFLAWHTQLSGIGEDFGLHYDPWLYRGGLFLVGVATLMVIAAATHRRSVTGKLIGNPLFNYIGTRSYGLYLYHWPIYQIIRKEAGIGLTVPKFVLAMIVTLPITEASYRFIETPIRQGRLGQWIRRERRPRTTAAYVRRRQLTTVAMSATALVAFAGVSIAMAPDRCVGTVECSLVEGQRAIDDATSTTVEATSPSEPTSTTVAPLDSTSVDSTPPGQTTQPSTQTTTTTTTPTTTTTIPTTPPKPLAIGESVMLGAAPQMTAAGFLVDAVQNRQGKGVVQAIQQHRAAGELGDTVVVQSGTNGPVSQDTYDAMLAELQGVKYVLFVTIHADRAYTADNNAKIIALTRPGISVLYWDQLIDQHPEYLADGIHLKNAEGKQWYTDLIVGALQQAGWTKP